MTPYTNRYTLSDVDNRALLLDTALGLFARRGYDSVGVQEIVQTAGLTKPTLYHYFGSKDGLLTALLEEKHRPLLEAVQRAAEYDGDLTRTLRRVLDTYLDFLETSETFYRFWLSLIFSPPEHKASAVARRLFQSQFETLTLLFVQAAEHHGNMRGRHERYAYTFIGLINNLASLQLSTGKAIDIEARQTYLHQFSYGIYS